jgi:hypothetical protein
MWSRLPRRLLSSVRLLVVLGLLLPSARLLAAPLGGPCDPPIANPIACENTKPGNPASEWQISSAGDPSIQGFTTEISVNHGETVSFKIKTPATDYRLDIYRLGYYGGQGARKLATVQPSAALPQTQPACLNDAATGLYDCGNWAVSAAWAVPADAVSGIYLARLVREDGVTAASHVVFVVRDDGGRSDLLFQTADPTWQAYNNYGGRSLYDFNSTGGRAYKVSYNRPFNTRATTGGPRESWLFNAEYPMLRWVEANGYHVSYTTGGDVARRGAELLQHRVFLSVGHDEYWSAEQRANVETALAAGVHLAFFSGNEVFWKTRWEPSSDGTSTPYRTLVSYKETHDNAKTDPTAAWTGTWRDPRFSPPADGGRPENALTGTLFTVNGPRQDAISVPAADGKMRFWRNTTIANLAAGQVATLPTGTLGYEWDEDLDNGFRPPGLMRLSTTTLTVGQHLQDYGSTYATESATHSLTLYRHTSGALVFGAGTVQWAWGLDAEHDFGPSTPDAGMQQATVNLFADMGVQPATLQLGLAPASASADTIPPTSAITAPASGATVQYNTTVTISGTATDSGGGVVAGVEVSVDNGATWHRANGRATWSYSWRPTSGGTAVIRSRAVDDSGRLESAGPSITVMVQGDTAVPTISQVQVSDITDTSAVITWTTNEPSDSQVQYGLTTSYGSTTPLDATLVVSHQQAISSLTPDTLYHFRARSRDAAGNLGNSTDLTFTTGTAAGGMVVRFDDLTPANRELDGQYPGGQLDWGMNNWYLSGPWQALTTNSVSFARAGVTSATVAVLSNRRLLSLRAFNGGGSSTTVTLSCAGNAPRTQSVPANQVATITTNWTTACPTIAFSSSNGWDTNFDDLVFDAASPPGGPTPTTTPAATATSTATATRTPTATATAATASSTATTAATATPTSTSTPTVPSPTPTAAIPTSTPAATNTPASTPAITPTATGTITATATPCTPPTAQRCRR